MATNKRITYLDKANQIEKHLNEAGTILPRLLSMKQSVKHECTLDTALKQIVELDLFDEIQENWNNPKMGYDEFFNEVGKMWNFRQYLVENKFYEMAIESALMDHQDREANRIAGEFFDKYPTDALIYMHDHKLRNYVPIKDFINRINNWSCNIEELVELYQRRPELIQDRYGDIHYTCLDNFGEFYLAVLESEGEKKEKAMDAIVNQFYEKAINSDDEETLQVALGIAVDGGKRYCKEAEELEIKLNPNCDPEVQKYTEALDLINYLKEKVALTFKLNLPQKARVVKPSGSYGTISYEKYAGGNSDAAQANA